jgi:hypothetical protein
MTRKLLAVAALVMAFGLQTVHAAACGGLVAPNGAIRLQRATTLVAWHDGVEHYMTSFTYQGDVANLGWIVPLPAVPDKIEEGGAWTLQRLERETHPVPKDVFALDSSAQGAAPLPAEVLQRTKVEALDIAVLRGSGQAVAEWCKQNNFLLNDETRAHILTYALRSPIFMAAKYDVGAARLRGQFVGDGAPVLITMHTPHLWVPLEVLANENDAVKADLYLLTDGRTIVGGAGAILGEDPTGAALPGAPGFVVQRQEAMSPALFRDLSTDRNMSWVRPDGWLTYLTLDAPGRTVTYDMSVTTTGAMRLASMGAGPSAADNPPEARFVPDPPIDNRGALVAAIISVAVMVGTLVAAAVIAAMGRRRSRLSA